MKAQSQQTIEQLQQRYQKLDRRKIEAETNLKNASEQLENLRKEARTKYGTDDLESLKKMLSDMREENERKRREYQAQLDGIDRELEKVETEFSAADSESEQAVELFR